MSGMYDEGKPALRLMDVISNEALAALSTILQAVKRGWISDAEFQTLYDITVRQSILREELYTQVFEEIARYRPVGNALWYYTLILDMAYDYYRIARYCWEVGRVMKVFGRVEVGSDIENMISEMLNELSDFTRKVLNGRLESIDADKLLELEKMSDERYLTTLKELAEKDRVTKNDVINVLVLRHVERMLDHVEYLARKIRTF
uniref:Phosphate uptake regulator PhoU n=1 Tax=Thermogladius calderae TaxID=1200300 RepID=A0A7J3XXS2_9CREN